MTRRSRRDVLRGTALLAAGLPGLAWAQPAADMAAHIAEAFRMKRMAVEAGDQPYGAVMVLDGAIVGYGPSRVVQDRNENAHAERVALWDAQRKLGRSDLSGAVIVSTSRPCAICQRALALANVSRMVHGEAGLEAGKPRGL